MFAAIPKEFAAQPDDGRFVVNFRTPLGSSIEASSRALDRIEAELAAIPEVVGYFSAIGLGSVGQVNRGIVFVTLAPRAQRARSQAEVIEELRARLADLPGVLGFASPPSVVAGQRGEPLQFALVGPDLAGVAEQAERLRARLLAEPGLERVDLDLQLELPQLELRLDRARAAELGVAAADLAFAVNLLAGGVDHCQVQRRPGGRRTLRDPRQGARREVSPPRPSSASSCCAGATASWCASMPSPSRRRSWDRR
ncbi:MAG: efflux RND transporter permease subunit [Xanthomonadales bacterium]|nr:efflux RND transporter permease subunit [Xanthomonadales bacterium]